jgi:copper resistance protein C
VIRSNVLIIFILLVALFAPTHCQAHAILMESTPALNSTITGPEVDIILRFNVRIDGSRSRVRVATPDGTVSTLTLSSQISPDILRSHISHLKPGIYKLEWQVLASDGHVSHGEIPFAVTE